jgi:predicted ATPase
MRLKLENIGMLKKADIEVKGISLVAGPNDSGKSTINKLFYSVVRGLNVDRKTFETEKNKSLKKDYQDVIKVLKANKIDTTDIQTDDITEKWIEKISSLQTEVNITEHQKKEFISKVHRLNYYYNLDYDSKDSREEEVYQYLTNEFNKQISSIYLEQESKVEIIDIEGSTELNIDEHFINKGKIVNLTRNIDLYYNDAIFIESPLAIDNSLESHISLFESEEKITRGRKTHLKKVLSNQLPKNINLSKEHFDIIEKITKKILQIINGEVIVDSVEGTTYRKNGEDIDIDNVAIGIKSFGVIQLLIKKNRLNSRTLLIIDEPEVHLHPNWQIKYAEILVLLSKYLDIPMLLTSHSPYFIEALEAFSKKHEYTEQTNFYITEKSKDFNFAEVKNVSDNITPILDSISNAYYEIQDVRDEF